MKKPTPTVVKSKSTAGEPIAVQNVADMWQLLNHLDGLVVDEKSDLARIHERIEINKQRINIVSLAVRAGAIKGDQLRLTA